MAITTAETPEVFFTAIASKAQADAAESVLRDWVENADGPDPEDAKERDDIRGFIAGLNDGNERPEGFYRFTTSKTQSDATENVLRDWLDNAKGIEDDAIQERDDIRGFLAAMNDATPVR